MSDDSDERVKRAVERYAKKVEQDIQREQLNGMASEQRKRQQVDFQAAFLHKAQTIIEPVLERHAVKINGLSDGKWSDNPEARRRAVSVSCLVHRPTDDDYEIEMEVSQDTKRAALVFLSDSQKMKVVVSARGSVVGHPTHIEELDLEQTTDYNVGRLAADFVEKYLPAF